MEHTNTSFSSFALFPIAFANNNNNIQVKFKSYDIEFYKHHIKTTVMKDPEIVDRWISKTYEIHENKLHPNHEFLLLGLDTEWKNPINVSNSKPRSCDQHVTLFQPCIENCCLIFKLFHAPEIPRPLAEFLDDTNVTFAGVGVKLDAKKRMKDWGLSVEKIMDVAFCVAEKDRQSDYKCKGLKCLSEILLGKVMEKRKDVTESQ